VTKLPLTMLRGLLPPGLVPPGSLLPESGSVPAGSALPLSVLRVSPLLCSARAAYCSIPTGPAARPSQVRVQPPARCEEALSTKLAMPAESSL
jgi:hypothetical protein